MASLTILRDLFRYNSEFAVGMVLVLIVLGVAGLSFFSPYPPLDVYVVPPDLPPSWEYPLGTTSRGQDVFWQLTFAVRNTLLFGIIVAILSRIIPLFPILVLFYFVMRDQMSWALLAVVTASLGWAYDARLIRSIAMSLRTREFTRQAVFSGMSTGKIILQEHLPFVLPIVFSTTMNNINWSIGIEVTLSVLGFTDVNTPTIGGMIYWANQHTALVSGVWWWVTFPVLLVIILFIGLFLLAISMNEYIDPRSRLSRLGGRA